MSATARPLRTATAAPQSLAAPASPAARIVRRLLRNRAGVTGLAIIALILATAGTGLLVVASEWLRMQPVAANDYVYGVRRPVANGPSGHRVRHRALSAKSNGHAAENGHDV